MARKSNQKSVAQAQGSSSKRRMSSAAAAGVSPKRAKRQSSSAKRASKSKFFQEEHSEDPGSTSDQDLSEEFSAFEEAESSVASAGDDEDWDDDGFDESKAHRSRQNRNHGRAKIEEPTSQKGGSKTIGKLRAKDLSRPGVKTGLGPGTQVIIKKPKARDAGDTPYSDETIHPNTMLFLKDLAANNNRQWLKMHDPDYRIAQKDWASFVESLTQKIIEADETVPELPVKDVIFRIYRDVRFTSDPTPYKTTFSAAWSRTGRKGRYAAYYVQIKPGDGSLVAGGLWMPEAQALARLRRHIDRRSHLLKQTLLGAGIRKEFLGGVASDEGKVAKAFAAQNQENALKTKPKGFDAEHREIELLRLRSFTLHRKLRDEEILGSLACNQIGELVSYLVPFITYLNSVVMPDEETESSDEDEDEGNESLGDGD